MYIDLSDKKHREDLLDMMKDIATKSMERNKLNEHKEISFGSAILFNDHSVYYSHNIDITDSIAFCAESNAISYGISHDNTRKIKIVLIVNNTNQIHLPCSKCGEVIFRFADKDCVLISGNRNDIFNEYRITLHEQGHYKYNLLSKNI